MPEADITNISIGASPGLQFAAEFDRDFSVYDFVFFDSVPNDEEYSSRNKGYSSDEFVSEIIYDICAKIASQSQLIVLGICTQASFYKESVTYSRRRSIAALCKAHFIDTRNIFKAHAQYLMLATKASSLYDIHPAHPYPPMMKIVGSAIAESLKKLSQQDKNISSHTLTLNNKYMKVSSEAFNVGSPKTLSNSLLTETFSVLTETDCLEFSTPNRCLGFYLNHAATNTKLELVTLKKSHHINLANNRTSPRLLKVFVALPNAPEVSAIRVLPPARKETNDYNPLIFSKYLAKDAPTALQLSSCIFLKPHPEVVNICSNAEPDTLNKMIHENLNNLHALQFSEAKATQELKIASIKNSFDQYIYFNSNINRCISLDTQAISKEVTELHPVHINYIDNRAFLSVTINHNNFTLSFYSNSISLCDKLPLETPAPKGDYLGNSFEFLKFNDSAFSMYCNGKYVFSAPNHELSCDRSEARRCEKFLITLSSPNIFTAHIGH